MIDKNRPRAFRVWNLIYWWSCTERVKWWCWNWNTQCNRMLSMDFTVFINLMISQLIFMFPCRTTFKNAVSNSQRKRTSTRLRKWEERPKQHLQMYMYVSDVFFLIWWYVNFTSLFVISHLHTCPPELIHWTKANFFNLHIITLSFISFIVHVIVSYSSGQCLVLLIFHK